ncbi:MAG: transporter substrate-binding domain-containing protein, partial [Butyricicoccus sp.]|nr:transporter substrate-binding domain-containing protein [Butyricicoccus sp.]
MKTKRLLSLLLAGAMTTVMLAGCGGNKAPAASSGAASGAASSSASAESDLDYIKGNGKMVIGYTVFEPMNYTDENGEFTGFDTELATAVCEKLGVEPEFQLIDWGTKEAELAGKSIDCIWNGMTLDAEREANMNCTQPYIKNAQV